MREKITIILSVLAVIISLVSVAVAIQQNESSNDRTVRDQLTSTVTELIKLNAANARLLATPPEEQNPFFFQESSTNSQIAAPITRQSVFLVEKHPNIATDVDYVAIAQGLMIVGDNELADRYMLTATEKSPSDFYKIINLRGYADFLFRQGKHESGRNAYQKSLEIFDNDTDFNKLTNAYTYQMWMVSEAWNGFPQEAERHYQRASNLANSISSKTRNSNVIRQIEQAHDRTPPIPGIRD